ncbi:hypothetical protein OIU84_010268 [Salix udensis]|uniref:Uncharacterized protein n=1 Tax=Salix udensis TaxID=889485 RepID=A0AAD6NVN8_9ROSI|nr:hypothetical protein OIU84_010268 [Salix udensis]
MEDGFGMKVTRINPTPKTVPSLRLSTCSKWKKRCGESELAMAAGRVRYAKVNILGALPAGNCRTGLTCDQENTHRTEPETKDAMLKPDPVHNQIISTVIKEMDYGDRKVRFLNITHLTQSRYGHPS